MRGSSRQFERGALAALVPVLTLLPFSLLALAAVWLPFGLLFDVPYWVVPVGWLLAGTMLFFRPFQVGVLTPLFGARKPTPAEVEIIRPLWGEIARHNDLPPDRYVVRILPSDELNAFACGGHLVILTTFAVRQLPPRELAGVLAHELSHHLGLHTVALTLGHWLSLPVVLLARVGFFLQNVANAATESWVSHSAALTALGRLVAGLLYAVSWVFLAALYASDALSNLVGHAVELEADRRAVRMGYGRHLAAALRRVVALTGGERPVGWRARLATAHPPARTRVARIEAMLRHPGQ